MNKPKSKLIGKVVEIINKGHWLYNGYGVIVHFDGDYYHVIPWCIDFETCEKESAIVFKRSEFKIK